MEYQVFFIGGLTGWAVAEFDAEGNQVGHADYAFRKADAIRYARAGAGGCQPIKVFGRDGQLQRTINAAAGARA